MYKIVSHGGSINRTEDKCSLPFDLQKSLYQTVFESHLLYGIKIWGVSAVKFALFSKFRKSG